eukprot:12749-Chlamydomonas_euryale.AAC.1
MLITHPQPKGANAGAVYTDNAVYKEFHNVNSHIGLFHHTMARRPGARLSVTKPSHSEANLVLLSERTVKLTHTTRSQTHHTALPSSHTGHTRTTNTERSPVHTHDTRPTNTERSPVHTHKTLAHPPQRVLTRLMLVRLTRQLSPHVGQGCVQRCLTLRRRRQERLAAGRSLLLEPEVT